MYIFFFATEHFTDSCTKIPCLHQLQKLTSLGFENMQDLFELGNGLLLAQEHASKSVTGARLW